MKVVIILHLKLLKLSVDEENLAMKQKSAYYSINTQKSVSTFYGYHVFNYSGIFEAWVKHK